MDLRRLLLAFLLLQGEAVRCRSPGAKKAPRPKSREICFYVKAVYNGRFARYVKQRNKKDPKEYIEKLFDLANDYFRCERLGSYANVRVYTSRIVPDDRRRANTWRAGNNIDWSVKKHYDDPDAPHVTFFTYDSDSNSVWGIQWGGSSRNCTSTSTPIRVKLYSMVEAQTSLHYTAQILAHELGHAIGIGDDRRGCGRGHMMADGNGHDSWSRCSVKDLGKALKTDENYCRNRKWMKSCPAAKKTHLCPSLKLAKPRAYEAKQRASLTFRWG